jgi:cytoskeletal protein RodZ
MAEGSKKFLITTVGIIAVLAVIAGGLWYWFVGRQAAKKEPLPTFLSEEATQALETAQNPAKNVAETNPFKKEETNPLLNKYKNPFE